MMDKKIIDHIDRYGFYIFNNILTNGECDELTNELDRLLEMQNRKGKPPHVGAHEDYIFSVHYKSEKFLFLLDMPKILPYLEYYLGKNLIINTLNARKQINKEQVIHSDSRPHCECTAPLSDQTFSMIAAYALDDFTPENGSTRVIPGSHHWGGAPVQGEKYLGEVQVTAPKGSVILFKAHLWHGGGANSSGKRRWGIIAYYSMWFFKQSFDFTRDYPKDIVAKANPRQMQILGFHSIPPTNEFERIHTLTDYPVMK